MFVYCVITYVSVPGPVISCPTLMCYTCGLLSSLCIYSPLFCSVLWQVVLHPVSPPAHQCLLVAESWTVLLTLPFV